jgi:integrase
LAAGRGGFGLFLKGGATMSLTVKRHHRLVRAGKEGMHLDGPPNGAKGLYLVIEHRRNANWGLRYALAGKTRWMGLGSALLGDGVTLDEARDKARAARAKLREKIDPLAVRQQERAAAAAAALKQITFAEAAHEFHKQRESGWRNRKHAAQVLGSLKTFAFPTLGKLPVDVVDTPLVLKVLRPIWNDKTETASRLRGRIEAVLAWAQVNGYRSGDNPARWRGHLQQALPKPSAVAKVAHHAALPYADVPAFMQALRQRDGVAAQALQFLIYTAARTGSVLGARWSEIDLAHAVWTVPPDRMKAHREHRVPLSKPAVELLRSLYREHGNDSVFIGAHNGGSTLSATAMVALLRRMGRDDVTGHGFRSSFRTWAAEQTNFAREVGEAALAHAIPDKVEAAYKRSTFFDKRRALMAAWAKYCLSPPRQKAASNVVSIGAR